MYNFQEAKIYEIRCRTTGLCYIGSTIRTLHDRLHEHEYSYILFSNYGMKYVSSFEVIKNGNYEIYLLENFPCDFICELKRREGLWQKIILCVNKKIIGKTRKEYYKENKEKIKNYYEENRDTISERNKKYYEDNKEKIKDYQKIYKGINTICECGTTVTRANIKRHKGTNKHFKLMENK